MSNLPILASEPNADDIYSAYLAELETAHVDVPASPDPVSPRSTTPPPTVKRRAPIHSSTGGHGESIWYTVDPEREAEYEQACLYARKHLHPSQRFEYLSRASNRIFAK